MRPRHCYLIGELFRVEKLSRCMRTDEALRVIDDKRLTYRRSGEAANV